MSKLRVRLYVRPNCGTCDQAADRLREAVGGTSVQVETVDVSSDPVYSQLYGDHLPVVDFGDNVRLYWPFSIDEIRQSLQQVRSSQPAQGCARWLVIAVDRFVYLFSKYWLLFIIVLIGIYAGLPLLAPLLMGAGYETPANLIYSAYRFACHQLPSRSFFVGGQQVAYCERCMATYTSLLVAAILFGFVRHRLKPLSWKLYLLFLVPMAIDGLTQLVGLRTSGWVLRTITGALFGFGSAWFAFPYLEQGFRDARQQIEDKLPSD